jgi:hypothetical protein
MFFSIPDDSGEWLVELCAVGSNHLQLKVVFVRDELESIVKVKALRD